MSRWGYATVGNTWQRELPWDIPLVPTRTVALRRAVYAPYMLSFSKTQGRPTLKRKHVARASRVFPGECTGVN